MRETLEWNTLIEQINKEKFCEVILLNSGILGNNIKSSLKTYLLLI